ncbi:hypothetical protein [Rhodanobacter sp. 115]|uniref:PDZ domain-containing protein n=1 Tax=Rhodanobacter sp. FW021-MT20 TaxID=1162282 RepID=UPI001ED95373|nr:hypothetical protein [Rhodanobacter sp. 115]
MRAGSDAAQAGLATGDIVVGVGNYRVTSVRDMQRLAGMQPRVLTLVVASHGNLHYVQIP